MTPNAALIPDTVGDLLVRWTEDMQLTVDAGERSAATVTTYRRGLNRFMDWCNANGKHQVTKTTVRQWIAAELAAGRKPRAINTWLAGIRSFYNWADEGGIFATNPTTGIKGPARRNTKRKHYRDPLTDSEMQQLLGAPQGDSPKAIRDRAILYLFAYTAARTVELHRANIADLRTKQGHVVLEVLGKGRTEPDDLVIPSAAREALAAWLAIRKQVIPASNDDGALFVSLSNRGLGSRLSLKSYREMVKGYMAAVGIVRDRVTTHSLRHTSITKLIDAVGPTRAREVSRHQSLETLMIYYHEQRRFDDPPEEYIQY